MLSPDALPDPSSTDDPADGHGPPAPVPDVPHLGPRFHPLRDFDVLWLEQLAAEMRRYLQQVRPVSEPH